MRTRLIRPIQASGLVMLLALLAACGNTSPASGVLESDVVSLRATISFYQSLDPTMTAQAGISSQQLATMQFERDQARRDVQNLTVTLNAITGGGVPVAANPPTLDPNATPFAGAVPTTGADSGFGSVPTPAPTIAAQSVDPAQTAAPARAPSGMALEGATMAKGKDENTGCAVNQTSTFSLDDPQIYVIVTVRNFKRGTKFEARWTGGNAFETANDWTTSSGGSEMCVHFYIEPATLQLSAGTYSVVVAATDSSGTAETTPLQFTLQ
jgi:hypothetical protein